MTNPNIGKLVRSQENDLGVGKVIESNRETAIIEYFDSAISSSWPRFEVAMTSLRAVKLDEQTRVYFFDDTAGCWRMGRVHAQVDDEVFVDLPNGGQARMEARKLFVRWFRPLADPWDHLSARLTETPYFYAARNGLVRHLVQQRASSGGMTGLLSAPISLEPHQIEVVRRVLTDPVQRYLLADEVGLGKTIEAGVIIRQHVLDHTDTHNVLVLTPGSLTGQWKNELTARCQVGEEFGHRVKVLAFEDLQEWQCEQPDFVVVDEAHQLSRGAANGAGHLLQSRFEAVRRLSAPTVCPNLLLLTATPVLRNERGFLALLHLLDPAVYDLDDSEAFKLRIASRQELADLFAGFTEDQQPFFLEGMVDQLSGLFPADRRLADLLNELRPMLANEDSKVPTMVRQVRAYLSESYRLHRRLLRNRRCADLEGLLPGRKKLITASWADGGIGRAEEALEQWRTRAAASVWGRETSDDAHVLSRVFVILLESLWSDPLAFAYLVKIRHARRLLKPPAIYGDLLDDVRLNLLTGTPTFEGEDECLQNMADLHEVLKGTRTAFLRTAQQFVRVLLDKGFRVVCMATCPSVADDFYQVLAVRCPDRASRHSSNEDSWRGRWESEITQVLVCDASAEEGVNLQGGRACMLHLDMPLSPNRLEQRMGRLDRFGVGKSVPSFALEPESASYWQAWSHCLADAWQVFSRSIAALQYAVDDEMSALEKQMFLNGVDAIQAATLRLSAPEGIEREFRFIRNQDELDAIETGSGAVAAGLAASIESYESEATGFQTELERWFVGCLHFERVGETSPGDSVLRYHFARPERGKHTLLPSSALLHWFKKAFDAEVDHPHSDPPLTHALAYGRKTAQSRHVGLARLGNPVVDAVSAHLLWDDRGTSFALWRRAETFGIFFRLDFIVETDLSALIKESTSCSSALQRQADAAFPPITETLWIGRDLMEPDSEMLAILRLPYRKPEDANVCAAHWPKILNYLQCDDWSGLCASVRSAAEQVLRAKHALGDLTEQCALAFEAQCAVSQEQLRSRIAALPLTRNTEREQLEGELDRSARIVQLMAAGVRQPIVRLDAAGVVFLSDRKLEDIGA